MKWPWISRKKHEKALQKARNSHPPDAFRVYYDIDLRVLRDAANASSHERQVFTAYVAKHIAGCIEKEIKKMKGVSHGD